MFKAEVTSNVKDNIYQVLKNVISLWVSLEVRDKNELYSFFLPFFVL